MNKKIIRLLPLGCLTIALVICAYAVRPNVIEAYDFEGNESYWTNYCSGVITDANKQEACRQYSAYISDKVNSSKNQANDVSNNIAAVKDDLSNLRQVSQEYADNIASSEKAVATINESLKTMQDNIAKLDVSIAETKVKITSRKEIIKKRMVEMQPSINTNQFIQYVMGASDLVDLVQRANSVESFTKNDKQLIKELNAEEKKLEAEQKEQERISATLEVQKENLKAEQARLTALKEANDKMVAENTQKVAELEQQRNEANAAANTLAALSPTFTINAGGGGQNGSANVGNISSNGMIAPIQGSYISRGIQVGHRGVDWAAGLGTPIVAPADCYVVFASTGYGTGYLGCWDGIPAGGGNSVRIIFNVRGQTYAMNFHHMQAASGTSLAYQGTSTVVKQGTVLGWVGSSGNSSGPHAHCELFTLNQTIQQAVATWYATGDWQSGCGWGLYTPASSSYATRVDPLAYF